MRKEASKEESVDMGGMVEAGEGAASQAARLGGVSRPCSTALR